MKSRREEDDDDDEEEEDDDDDDDDEEEDDDDEDEGTEGQHPHPSYRPKPRTKADGRNASEPRRGNLEAILGSTRVHGSSWGNLEVVSGSWGRFGATPGSNRGHKVA